MAPDWTSTELAQVLPQVAALGPVEQGVDRLRSAGNPISAAEIDRLQEYVHRARGAQITFTPEEARDLRELAERVAREHTGEVWVKDLLTLGLFVFAVYALAPSHKST